MPHHLATDLTLSAMGGSMALNGEPTAGRCASPCRRRGTTLRRRAPPARWSPTSARSAHRRGPVRRRLRAGGGVLDRLNAMIAHAIQGQNIERNGTVLQLSTLTTPLVYPCADGEVVLIATTATLLWMVPWMVEYGP